MIAVAAIAAVEAAAYQPMFVATVPPTATPTLSNKIEQYQQKNTSSYSPTRIEEWGDLLTRNVKSNKNPLVKWNQ